MPGDVGARVGARLPVRWGCGAARLALVRRWRGRGGKRTGEGECGGGGARGRDGRRHHHRLVRWQALRVQIRTPVVEK